MHSDDRALNLGEIIMAGLRLTISGLIKPRKSQITIVPGFGWNFSILQSSRDIS